MFGRRLRSRLDLLWPTDTVSAQVAERQQAQRRDHTGTPRTVQFSPESPVMIRNYTPGGSKWIPSTVMKQAGPLSYKCILSTGAVVKRHQEQMLSKGTTSPKSPSSVLPPVPIDSNSPTRTLTPNESPPSLPQSTNPTQTNEEPVVQSSPA